MNWSFAWLIKQDCLTSPPRISAKIYSILWLLALLGAAISYYELPTTKLLGIGGLISAIFAGATIAQQIAVYRDLHNIEDDTGDVKSEYGPWIDIPVERWIRYGIIISLLFGVGKIAGVVYPLFIYVDKIFNYIGLYGGQCLQSVLGGIFQPERLFVIGSCFAFFFLLVWNIGAFLMRMNESKPQSFQQHVDHVLISVRIVAFMLSVVFCLVYWVTVYKGSDVWVSTYSEVFFVLYILTIVAVLFLRSTWFQQMLKKLITWVKDELRKEGTAD